MIIADNLSKYIVIDYHYPKLYSKVQHEDFGYWTQGNKFGNTL